MKPPAPSKTQIASNVIGLVRLERKLEAAMRAIQAGPSTTGLPDPESLLAQRFPLYAQNDEDGLVVSLLGNEWWEAPSFVEIGCGHNGGNSGTLARELLFSGLMVDGDPELVAECARRFARDKVTVVTSFVTAENVNELIAEAGLPTDLGFMSIDIDGNDVWIWDAVTVVEPRVVCVEFNGLFGPVRNAAIPYSPSFHRHDPLIPSSVRGVYYGASLAALVAVGRRRGYRLVVVDPRGTNAFFVRSDFAPLVHEVSAVDAFRQLDKNRKRAARGVDVAAQAQRAGLALVEVT